MKLKKKSKDLGKNKVDVVRATLRFVSVLTYSDNTVYAVCFAHPNYAFVATPHIQKPFSAAEDSDNI